MLSLTFSVYDSLLRENVVQKVDVGSFSCDPTLDEISSKRLAICVIGQSYEAKTHLVNELFALKNGHVIEPTGQIRRRPPSRLSRLGSEP